VLQVVQDPPVSQDNQVPLVQREMKVNEVFGVQQVLKVPLVIQEDRELKVQVVQEV